MSRLLFLLVVALVSVFHAQASEDRDVDTSCVERSMVDSSDVDSVVNGCYKADADEGVQSDPITLAGLKAEVSTLKTQYKAAMKKLDVSNDDEYEAEEKDNEAAENDKEASDDDDKSDADAKEDQNEAPEEEEENASETEKDEKEAPEEEENATEAERVRRSLDVATTKEKKDGPAEDQESETAVEEDAVDSDELDDPDVKDAQESGRKDPRPWGFRRRTSWSSRRRSFSFRRRFSTRRRSWRRRTVRRRSWRRRTVRRRSWRRRTVRRRSWRRRTVRRRSLRRRTTRRRSWFRRRRTSSVRRRSWRRRTVRRRSLRRRTTRRRSWFGRRRTSSVRRRSWRRRSYGRPGRATVNGCSIPLGMSFFYKSAFTSSCNHHDVCYYREFHSQRSCDNTFYRNMLHRCKSYGSVKGFFCRRFAGVYYRAVRVFGKSHYG